MSPSSQLRSSPIQSDHVGLGARARFLSSLRTVTFLLRTQTKKNNSNRMKRKGEIIANIVADRWKSAQTSHVTVCHFNWVHQNRITFIFFCLHGCFCMGAHNESKFRSSVVANRFCSLLIFTIAHARDLPCRLFGWLHRTRAHSLKPIIIHLILLI